MTIEEVLKDKDFLEELITAKMHIWLITSKEFIEAVARGLEDNNTLNWTRRQNTECIAKKQALAIMNDSLDDFIKAILPK